MVELQPEVLVLHWNRKRLPIRCQDEIEMKDIEKKFFGEETSKSWKHIYGEELWNTEEVLNHKSVPSNAMKVIYIG